MSMAFAIRQSLNILRAIRTECVISRNFRMSAKLRAEEALEEMKKKNPYFEKYATKIAALQQTSPEEFLNRLDSANEKPQKKQEKER